MILIVFYPIVIQSLSLRDHLPIVSRTFSGLFPILVQKLFLVVVRSLDNRLLVVFRSFADSFPDVVQTRSERCVAVRDSTVYFSCPIALQRCSSSVPPVFQSCSFPVVLVVQQISCCFQSVSRQLIRAVSNRCQDALRIHSNQFCPVRISDRLPIISRMFSRRVPIVVRLPVRCPVLFR